MRVHLPVFLDHRPRRFHPRHVAVIGGTGVGAPEDQVRHAVRIAHRIRDVSGADVSEGEEREPLETQALQHRFEVEDLRFEAVVRYLPVG